MAYMLRSGRYRAEKMINGQRKRLTFDTEAEAKIWELSQKADVWAEEEAKASGTILTALSAGNKYLDMAEKCMVRKTYMEKKLAIKNLFKGVDPNIEMSKITTEQATEALALGAEKRTGNAINGDRKNLRAWWNWCKKHLKLKGDNPFADMDLLPEERSPRIIPRKQDVETLLNKEQGMIRNMLLTMLHTAARADEVFRMKWGDLDFERRTVRLWTRKRKGGTMEFDLLPMTEELREVLLEHKKTAISVFVFCQDDGQPLHHDLDIMEKLCQKHDLPKFGFHGIRHLSASMMDEAGKSLAVIQLMLRHKNAMTTAKYLHSLRGLRAEMDNVFSFGKAKAHEQELVSLQG